MMIIHFLKTNNIDLSYILTNIKIKDKLEEDRYVKLHKAVSFVVDTIVSNNYTKSLKDDLKQITIFKLYKYKNPFEEMQIHSNKSKYLNYVITVAKNSLFDYLRWLNSSVEDLTQTGELPDYHEEASIMGEVMENLTQVCQDYIESKIGIMHPSAFKNAEKDISNFLRMINGETVFQILGTDNRTIRNNFHQRMKRLKDSLIDVTKHMILKNKIDSEIGGMIVKLLQNYVPNFSSYG